MAEDLRSGRVYLPIEDLAALRRQRGRPAGRVVSPPGSVAARASSANGRASYYDRAAPQLPRSIDGSLVAAEIMGAIYLEILRRIERRGYDVFSARVRVPRPQRAAIALHVWLGRSLKVRSPRCEVRCEGASECRRTDSTEHPAGGDYGGENQEQREDGHGQRTGRDIPQRRFPTRLRNEPGNQERRNA